MKRLPTFLTCVLLQGEKEERRRHDGEQGAGTEYAVLAAIDTSVALGRPSSSWTGSYANLEPRPVGCIRLNFCVSTVLISGTAAADYEAPRPQIVWSYPAQGDTGVPTNVDLWLLALSSSGMRVSLDGVELARLDVRYGWELGELEPDTSYTLLVEPINDDSRGPFELTFSTGSGPAETDPAAEPGVVVTRSTRGDVLTDACQNVLATQECFDTGQDTYFHFTPSGQAKGWILDADVGSGRSVLLWPEECGSPRLLMHYNSQP